MYCDSLGLVSTGVGVLLQQESGSIYPRFLEAANAALWEKNGKPATAADVQKEFDLVSNMCKERRAKCLNPRVTGGKCRAGSDGQFSQAQAKARDRTSTLRLSNDGAAKLFNDIMDKMVAGATRDISSVAQFDSLPAPARASLIDLRYGVGNVASGGWPSLHRALKAKDYVEASRQIFTSTGRLWVACQRWKWMVDAATCESGGSVEGSTSTTTEDSVDPETVEPEEDEEAEVLDDGPEDVHEPVDIHDGLPPARPETLSCPADVR